MGARANQGYKIFLLTTAFVVTLCSSFAQNLDAVQKLRTKLKSANDEEKFNLYCSIGFEYRYSYPDSTLFYCQKAFDFGRQTGMNTDLAKPLSFIGLAYA